MQRSSWIVVVAIAIVVVCRRRRLQRPLNEFRSHYYRRRQLDFQCIRNH